jgi:2-keto-4-pentenoate hydratase
MYYAALALILLLSAGCCTRCKDATAISRHMLTARVTGSQIEPPSSAIGPMNLSIAYLAQDYLVEEITAGGDRVVGYKVAFTNPASQAAFGAPGPAYGRVLFTQRRPSGATIPAGEFHKLAIEMEVAMIIGRKIDKPLAGVEELRPYVRAVCPAIELPQDHFRPGAARPRFEDLVADNVGAHRFVLGPEMDPAGVDLGALSAALTRDGKTVATGRARDVLGGPWQSLLWLANGLTAAGFPLEPGQVVLTGSLTAPYRPAPEAAAGTYTADLGPLGKASCVVGK